MLRAALYVLGFALVCFGIFTGGAAVAPVVMAGAGLMGLPAILARSNPRDPRAVKPPRIAPYAPGCDRNTPGVRWNQEAHEWQAPSDPYAAKLTVDQAFGADPLTEYDAAIKGLQADHAAGKLSSEAFADCIENIEQVASVRARDPRLKKMGEAYKSAPGKHPAEFDTIKRARKVFGTRQLEAEAKAAVVELEVKAKAAERAIAKMKPIKVTDAPGQIAVTLPRTCNQCASVYTNAYHPVARYCDGSCKE